MEASLPKEKSKKKLGERFQLVVIPPSCGKSVLSTQLEKTSSKGKKDYLWIDLDAFIDPEIKDDPEKIEAELLKVYQEYKKFKVVVITSNRAIFKKMGVNSDQTHCYYPETYFFLRLLSNRGLIQPNLHFSSVELNQSLQFPSVPSKTENNYNYSLTQQKKQFQSTIPLNNLNQSEIDRLYDQEVRGICNARDKIIRTKGSRKYSSLQDLTNQVLEDV